MGLRGFRCLVIVLGGMLMPCVPSSAYAQGATYQVTYMASGEPDFERQWPDKVWNYAGAITISQVMGEPPKFKPIAHAKMGYDRKFLYVVFRTLDKHVSSEITDYNGPVSQDACVEFFFAPDTAQPLRYFNLEINAGGIPLMGYYAYDTKVYTKVGKEDLEKLEIRSSFPKGVVDAVEGPVTWTIACKIPLDMLEQYAPVTSPESEIIWRANFYKTASKTANPHWMTWAAIDYDKPNFHLPEYFGKLAFD